MAEAKNTGQPDHDTKVVRIWDDPESRINFLETILKNKEWEAVIYHPEFNEDATQKQGAATPLPELENKLKARGYATKLGQDENGIPTLSVHNFGSDTTLADAVKEMGFAKGMTHKITHIKEPLGDALHKTANMVKHVTGDKARLIGGLYLVGDLFLIFAGLGNDKDKDGNDEPGAGIKAALKHPGTLIKGAADSVAALKEPANLLQSVSGVLATVQSLIYMGFAKEGSEAMYSELMGRAKDANKEGKDLLDASLWQDKEERGPKGLLGLPHKALKNYPIQLGALTQVAGQLTLMASGGLRLQSMKGDTSAEARRQRRGSIQDMITATSSVIGWSLLTKKKSEKIAPEDKAAWSNPKRMWQEMSANPNQFASAFLSTATLSGIAAGHAKSNKIQTMGNLTYLFGDGIMFATKSDNYGAEGMGKSSMLAEAAERFVKTSPIVLGEKQEAQFVQQLSTHLAERSLYDDAKKTKQDVTEQQVEELGQRIAADLSARLPKVNERANDAAARIAGVVEVFNPYFGEKIADSLCAAVCEQQGVAIDKDELKAHVQRQVEYPKEPSTDMVKMDDVAKPLADLLFALPGGANAATVDALYGALDEHIRPEPMQSQEKLETAINQTATQDLAAAAAQGKAVAPTPQGMGAHTAALLSRQAAPVTSLNR